MNEMLQAFTLAAMQSLAPEGHHDVLAGAIARRVDAELPLFKDDGDKRKTAAVLVAIAWRESNFKLDAVGDGGTSLCAFQVSNAVGGTRAMLTDADACVAAAMRVLRWSVRFCAAHPLAGYASGLNGCTNARAQRISRDRLSIAARLVREVVADRKASFYLPPGAAPLRVTRMSGVCALNRREEAAS